MCKIKKKWLEIIGRADEPKMDFGIASVASAVDEATWFGRSRLIVMKTTIAMTCNFFEAPILYLCLIRKKEGLKDEDEC